VNSADPFRLERQAFSALPFWKTDDHQAAFLAFRHSAIRHLEAPYKQRRIGFDATLFRSICVASTQAKSETIDDIEARTFFETYFDPYVIVPLAGETKNQKSGHVTGYYEPVIEARRDAGDGFTTPFLRRPDDLVELSDDEAIMIGPKRARFARKTGRGLEPYFDRSAIETGALSGRGLEIAFVRDPVDAFFAHVQGCARLQLPDDEIRITYDGKSGHDFTGIGRLLIERGEIEKSNISMQTIRDWLAANVDRAPALMRENRSYIFFREARVDDADRGPIAAAKVAISAGRSIAVDRLIHAFGLPFYVSVPKLKVGLTQSFNRLMIAQDTGSAIIGAARADLFMGSGDAAGEIAGSINHEARFHILLPKGSAVHVNPLAAGVPT
jgi:membrane-bound lytic murein transglycosylase A